MDARQYIRIETPEAIYELYMAMAPKDAIPQFSLDELERMSLKEYCALLGKITRAKCGSVEMSDAVIEHLRPHLVLMKRMGTYNRLSYLELLLQHL